MQEKREGVVHGMEKICNRSLFFGGGGGGNKTEKVNPKTFWTTNCFSFTLCDI